MEQIMGIAHGILTAALLAGYLWLFYRFRRKTDETVIRLDRTLAQIVRFSLLLVYLSGLYMSVTLSRMVHPLHHILSALPVVVLLGIQFYPTLSKKEMTIKAYTWTFILMFFLILLTAISSTLSDMPQF